MSLAILNIPFYCSHSATWQTLILGISGNKLIQTGLYDFIVFFLKRLPASTVCHTNRAARRNNVEQHFRILSTFMYFNLWFIEIFSLSGASCESSVRVSLVSFSFAKDLFVRTKTNNKRDKWYFPLCRKRSLSLYCIIICRISISMIFHKPLPDTSKWNLFVK